MSKSNVPPTYEESKHQQHQYGAYPQGATYPFAPHTMAPHTTAWHGSGYPATGMPPIIPTYCSSRVPTCNPEETEGLATNDLYESQSVRHAFIRKVYLILAAQLLFTTSIVAVFTFVDPVRLFVIQNPEIYWVSFLVYLVAYIMLVCCEHTRRRFPLNLVLLFIFTLAMSYMAGTIASYYSTKAVFLSLLITAIVCVAVTIFCFQTKVDFTSCPGLFCALAIVVLITGIITAIVLSFEYVPWLHMLYAAIGAIAYTLLLAYDTQLLLGDRAQSLNPEDYVYGALSLYTDVIQIFIFILQLTGYSSD